MRILDRIDYFMVSISTDEGITGFGYSPVQYNNPWSFYYILEKNMAKYLTGEDPLATEKTWYNLFNEIYRERKGTAIRVLSVIDMALWDIKGKKLGLPLYKLLGGFREEVPCYASGGYYGKGKTTRELADEMSRYRELGFDAVKMKIGVQTIDKDIERVKTVRKAIGYDVKLIVDANNAYEVKAAIKIGRELEKLDVYWFEEPIWIDDMKGCARVANAIDVPIASGQSEYTRYGFRDLIESRAVDILQPDVTVVGGVSEWLKVAAMASAHNTPLAPHWDGSAGTVWDQNVHAHLAAVVPSVMYVEFFRPSPDEYPELKRGCMTVPRTPGLGVELDEKKLEEFRIN